MPLHKNCGHTLAATQQKRSYVASGDIFPESKEIGAVLFLNLLQYFLLFIYYTYYFVVNNV